MNEMQILGERIFARDAQGRLLSRIGTMFFRTPGLVTRKGVHAMQRFAWIEYLNEQRATAGLAPLTLDQEDAEMAESVDLIFTDDQVLIRPNPDRMDLAFRADEELQKMVAKPAIRFLNTNSAKVRTALRERGENWRMARQPISQDDMKNLVLKSRVSMGEGQVYYYNHLTGTRFLTAGDFAAIGRLDAPSFRRQIAEIVHGMNSHNRLGRPEVDVFPPTTPQEVRLAFRELKVDELDDEKLKAECDRIATSWRMSLPADLRDESVDNFEWRNTLCHAITREPNETVAEEQELIAGISPEYYRQIEWLPGARIANGEVIFDAVYDEAERTQDPELLSLCDNRVRSFIFNMTRLHGGLAFVNAGRIAKSLSRLPVEGEKRGNVYIFQYREDGSDEIKVAIVRLQKWGVAEHLDEGKPLLQSMIEADEYSDYVLDRRLMCRQLGMNLPRRLGYGHFIEKYHGNAGYRGLAVKTPYFVRSYIPGTASDKFPRAKYRNPAFARRFAELMGEAAALDLVVGRRSSLDGKLVFDTNYEVVRLGADNLPAEVLVTDHAGSFVNYDRPFEDYVGEYGAFVTSRREWLADVKSFAEAYVGGFSRRLAEVRQSYRNRRRAFDELFSDRPYDSNGSGAYRWSKALKRLDECDPEKLGEMLLKACGC